ncbi:MAG TPA: TldD/PmbA family protein [Actinomycetota bacterium]|nr:TldD/PmbA family protein [Actinomycetota bacterium]
MLAEETIGKVLAAALGGGGDLAELFVEDNASTSLRLEERRVEGVASGYEAGAGVRVIAGDRTSYAYTNLLTEEALVETARAARAGLSEPPGTVADLTRTTPPVHHPVQTPPDGVAPADKVEALRAADDAARSAGGEVRQVIASYTDVRQKVLIAASDGRLVEDDRTRVRFVCHVVAGRDGEISTGFRGPGHSGGFELLEASPPAEVAAVAAEKAIAMLRARPSPAGDFPVVLAPGAGGVLIHEACGHGLEADTLVKNASVYSNRAGERFGSEDVTIVDDGSDVGAWGSVGVDDEGTPAQRTVLFDRGVLTGHLSDRLSAEKIGNPPTGNARRESYAHLPIVRMTNTYLLPGPDDPEEIVRSVERGVYAASFAGGEVNPATGNFVFGMSEAYMIENGELTYPIKGAQLIGNGPKVLNVIEAIAADFDRWEGICGKDGQSAPVTNGMPTTLLGTMTVGGTEA